MTYKKDKTSKFRLECSCGCGELQFVQWTGLGMGSLSYVIPAWYARSHTGFKNILRILWNIIRGREYCFYEIIIDDNKTLQDFKKFVAELDDIEEEVE